MTLTAFTEGPRQTKGRETLSHGQCRAAELNTTNFCKSFSTGSQNEIAQTPSLATNHLEEGKVGEKLLRCMHHLHFPLLKGKRKSQSVSHLSFGLRKTKDDKIRRNKKLFSHAIILIAFNALIIQGLFPEAPDAI